MPVWQVSLWCESCNEATLQIPYKSSSCSEHPELECPWIERNILFPGTTCNCLSLVSFVESDFSLWQRWVAHVGGVLPKVCCFISWMLLNKVSSFQKAHYNELFAGYHWWIHKTHWKHQLSLSNGMAWIFITFYLLYVYSISWTGKNSKTHYKSFPLINIHDVKFNLFSSPPKTKQPIHWFNNLYFKKRYFFPFSDNKNLCTVLKTDSCG